MIRQQNPQPAGDWLFRGFLMGAALGSLFGLLTSDVWNAKPYPAQIAAAFWALLFGIMGLLIGSIHRLARRRGRPGKDVPMKVNRDARSHQLEWTQLVVASPVSVPLGPRPPQAPGNEACDSRGVKPKADRNHPGAAGPGEDRTDERK
jgi:hypothetical protein